MHDQIHAFVAIASRLFACDGPVFQLGSRLAADDEQSLAALFPGREFLGIDQRRGPGVDRVEDYAELSLDDASAGTIVCLEQLECTFDVPRLIDELLRVLRPGGTLILATRFDAEVNGSPSDYWRVTPGCLARLTSQLESRVLGWHSPDRGRQINYCLGSKSPAPVRFANDARALTRALTDWLKAEDEAQPWPRRLKSKMAHLVAALRRRPETEQRSGLQFSLDLSDRQSWRSAVLGGPSNNAKPRAKAG